MIGSAALALLAAALPLPQDTPDKAHVPVYKKVAPATVYVSGGGEEGSGVLIDPSGLILTSPTACGSTTRSVTVLTAGARAWQGKVVGRLNEKELVLVKIDAENLPCLELGDSDAARVGQVSYVFGDSYNSMKTDDQPAMSLGVISGIYDVRKKLGGSQYTGRVLETSAAVNPNQDGGPLVDRQGRLLGIVTLNYEDSKFTGVAVPINLLKADIERLRKAPETPPAAVSSPPPPEAKREPAWLGAEVRAVDGGLEVTRVSKGGPAEKGGLRKGDVLQRAGEVRLLTRAALDKQLEARAPGDAVVFSLAREGASAEVRVTLGRRPLY